jgi:hypothetical protein
MRYIFIRVPSFNKLILWGGGDRSNLNWDSRVSEDGTCGQVDENVLYVLFYSLYFMQRIQNYIPLKNFTFYGTRGFITVFKRALRWSQFWARLIQSMPPNSSSLRSNYNIFSPSKSSSSLRSLSFRFSHQSYMNSSTPHSCYMSWPSPPW